jgi:hypothetical protein
VITRATAAGLGLLLLLLGWLADTGVGTAIVGAAGVLALAAALLLPATASSGAAAASTAATGAAASGARTLVAVAFLGQLAAGHPSLPMAAAGAVVLAGYLAAGEQCERGQDGARAWSAQPGPLATATGGVIATAAVAAIAVHGVSGVAAVALAAGLGAALLALLVGGRAQP